MTESWEEVWKAKPAGRGRGFCDDRASPQHGLRRNFRSKVAASAGRGTSGNGAERASPQEGVSMSGEHRHPRLLSTKPPALTLKPSGAAAIPFGVAVRHQGRMRLRRVREEFPAGVRGTTGEGACVPWRPGLLSSPVRLPCCFSVLQPRSFSLAAYSVAQRRAGLNFPCVGQLMRVSGPDGYNSGIK